MKHTLHNAILAITLLLSMAFPAFAEPATVPTKPALSRLIFEETKGKIKMSDIVRMVNSVFIETAKRGLDPLLALSLIGTESMYQSKAVSREGARGLTQVIPRWHRDKIRGRNIMHIETNIEVGMTVLADCFDDSKGNLSKALKCYSSNAKNYTAKLRKRYNQLQKAETLYRFENELPMEAMTSSTATPQFSISLNAPPPILAQEENLSSTASSIY